jgi:serine/threonine-protein kinase RsbW
MKVVSVMNNSSSNMAQQNVSAADSSMPDATAGTDARRIDIAIPSNAEFIRVVRLALLGVASRMNFSFDDVEDIKLALSEACNNAVLHSQTNENARVMVSFVPYSNRLEIYISDEGRVPPPGLPRPRHPMGNVDSSGESWQDLPEGGLGMFLMQSLMDEVQHRTAADANTTVRLVKYLPGQRPAHLHSGIHNDPIYPGNDGTVPSNPTA